MKNISASSKMVNCSEILLWAFLASCFVIINVATADGNITKLPTNCTLVGDYYECQSTGNVSGNSTFFISSGDIESCPYSCCVNEANYTDKNCTSGYQCTNNKCMPISTGIPETDNTVFIIIGVGLGIIVLVLIAYFILKRSRGRKPSKNFDELYRKYGKRGARRPARRTRR